MAQGRGNNANTARYANEGAPLSREEIRRKHDMKRKRRRKRKRVLTYVLLLLILAGVGVALSLTVFFNIETVEVKGNSYTYYTDEQIIQSANISIGSNMFLANTSAACERIEKENPYVSKATVVRRIPDKVIINIQEASASYVMECGQAYVLLSDSAKVLEQVTELPQGITVIKGAAAKSAVVGSEVEFENEDVMVTVKSFIAACQNAGLENITSVDVSNLSEISAVYDGRITLVIGAPTSLNKKLPLANEIIKRVEQDTPGQYGSIDLSILNKGYFKKTDAPETTAAAETTTASAETTAAQETTQTADGESQAE